MSALRQLSAPVVALLALGVLAACGDDEAADRPDGTPVESPSAFDAATATLMDGPFCAEVDTTLVAGALGMPADTVVLRSERVVDEERAGGSAAAAVNACVFGTRTKRLTVAVQPRGAAAEVRRRIDGSRQRPGCEVAADPWFGSPAAVAQCVYRGGRRTVAVTALVGGSGFFCSSAVDARTDGDLVEATVEVCRDTLEMLGVPG